MSIYWDKVKWEVDKHANNGIYESGLLKLNCDKALHYLNWHAVMQFDETVKMTAEWYRSYYQNPEMISEVTSRQILEYMEMARRLRLSWVSYD